MRTTTWRDDTWAAPFFVIWTGQAFSLLGSHLVQFALVWWLTQTTGSATVLATATLVATLPQIFLGFVAGTLVDRWNRRAVMVVADSAIALLTLGLAFLFMRGLMQVWHVYVIMALRSLGGGFHWPAMQASTSLMVPDKQLARVAGLNQTLYGLMNIIAPPLGALLIGVLPMYGVLAIDVGTALLAVLPLLFIALPQPARSRATATAGESQSVWGQMQEGLRYVRAWPGMLAVLVMVMLLNFTIVPAFSLMPILVTKFFGGGALELGWMESAWGVGVVAGGLFLSAWGGFRKRVVTALSGIVWQGLWLALVGFTPQHLFWLALAGMFAAGFANPITNGPFMALLQSQVSPEMQGRVMGLVQSAATAMMPLSLIVAGPLADLLGVRIWYVAGGLLTSLIGIVAFLLPTVMNIEENRSAHPSTTQQKTLLRSGRSSR